MIVVIGSGFANGESGFGEKEIEKGVEKSLSGSPGFEGHVSVGSGVVVELGRDEGEDDSDLLVRGNGNVEETFESRDLGVTIGVLKNRTNCQSRSHSSDKGEMLTLRPRCSMT